MSHGEGAQDLVKDKKSEVSVKRKIQSLKQNKTKPPRVFKEKEQIFQESIVKNVKQSKEFNPFMILELWWKGTGQYFTPQCLLPTLSM